MLNSDSLVDAFATVRREDFVGPGPWKISRPSSVLAYEQTPDTDPRHLYDNVLVALDASRNLNNGEPAALARWLASLELTPGDRFLHIGCGVGYYTAIAAEVVSSAGTVIGVEVDPDLAKRARQNLRPWKNSTVVLTDGSNFHSDPVHAIFVNAGATEPLPSWINQLRDGGRLLVPLTIDLPTPGLGLGHTLLVVRKTDGYQASFLSPVGIFHCVGARTTEGNDLLKLAYQGGDHDQVHSLRRDSHSPTPECWLHTRSFCLSRRPVDN